MGFVLSLLGIGKWLREAATALLRLAGRYPWQAALIASLCLSGWLWHGNTKRDRVIAGWQAASKAWEAASDANAAKAIAQVKAVEAKSAALAKDNQIHEQDIRRDYGARSIVYADRMRADKVCGRTAPAPAQDNPAPVDNSPGQDAIVVSRDDFDILTENTIRLKAAHDWGLALVKEGLAEPVVWPEPALGGE